MNTSTMLNKHFVLFFVLLGLLSCKDEAPAEEALETINLSLELERFDQIMYGASPKDIPIIRKKYPEFFVNEVPDSIYAQKITDSIYHELYLEVQNKFPNLQSYTAEIEDVLKRSKFYFPQFKTPSRLISLISEMDYQNKVIYTDSLLIVSLDLYLGENHRYYVGEFYDYQRKLFEPSQILPDVADALVRKLVPRNKESIFVEQIVAEGKIQYIKQQLLPNTDEHLIVGYSKEQQNWCLANEMYMWQYFVDTKLLFETGQKNHQRFIAPAPFSKFYLEIDSQSPGRVGVWLGLQIVKSYMDKNKVSLDELLKLEPKLIYENAKYKPKKS